jgi:hypothetical protein
VRSVAIQTITMNRVKNSSDDPRSFWKVMMPMAMNQATNTGPKWRGSGRYSGPTFQVACAKSARCSIR